MTGKCRFCNHGLEHTFCNLGKTPLSNSYLSKEQLSTSEPMYPLHAYVCSKCMLVQVEEFEKPENIFGDYSYFSSYSETWLNHAKKFADEMISCFNLDGKKQIIEIASNDGYLLQFFLEKKIPILGIEPAKNVARFAIEKGIPTITEFFGTHLSLELKKRGIIGDLIVANNVLAHVPDLNDFVEGIKTLLSSEGVASLEFPHLLNLVEENQFDTIYHEHFSYFSFHVVEQIFLSHGMVLFDVEQIPSHGGSLRIFACHEGKRVPGSRVKELKDLEKEKGYLTLDLYSSFFNKVEKFKSEFLEILDRLKDKSIVGYGAPAKGNTLLNFCGIKSDQIRFTVDRNPHKQGKFLPGSKIPILSLDQIAKEKPEYILLLPWNLKDEIMGQLDYVRSWGAKFIIPIPSPTII